MSDDPYVYSMWLQQIVQLLPGPLRTEVERFLENGEEPPYEFLKIIRDYARKESANDD